MAGGLGPRRGGPGSGSRPRSGRSSWSRSPGRRPGSRWRALLEGPQRTPAPVGGRGRRRAAPLGLDRGRPGDPAADGTVEPGAVVPLSVAFNVLTPEPAEVNLRCLAELRPIRGGDPIWRARVARGGRHRRPRAGQAPARRRGPGAGRDVCPGDQDVLGAARRRGGDPARPLGPAAAEPVADDLGDPPPDPGHPRPSAGRGAFAFQGRGSADRRGGRRDRPGPIQGASPVGLGPGSRSTRRVGRPGRSPRWRWSTPRSATASEAGSTGPWPTPSRSTLAPADSTGLAWSAVGLRVAHPERPHRLTLTVSGGHPASLGVAMVAGGGFGRPGAGRARRLRLGPADPRRGGAGDLLLAGLARLRGAGPGAGQPRALGPRPGRLDHPDRAGRAAAGADPDGLGTLARACTWPAPGRSTDSAAGDDSGRVDPLAQARNLSTYLAHCGASTVVLPEGLADRSTEARPARAGGRGLDRPRPARPAAPGPGPSRGDRLGRRRLRRPAARPAGARLARGGGRRAGPARPPRGARRPGSYQPIHPKVREAMARKVAEAVAPRKARPNLAGRPDPARAGLDPAGRPRHGARRRRRSPGSSPRRSSRSRRRRVPGQGSSDPGRFEARARYVEGSGRLPWLAWRAEGSRLDLFRAGPGRAEGRARRDPGRRRPPAWSPARPATRPGGSTSPGSDPARPGEGWGSTSARTGRPATVPRSSSGGPACRPTTSATTSPPAPSSTTGRRPADPGRPARGRGVRPRPEPFPIGRALRLTACPMADGPTGDEPLGHALAALDPRRVLISSTRPSPARRSGSAGSPGSSSPCQAPPTGPAEPEAPLGRGRPGDPLGGRHVPGPRQRHALPDPAGDRAPGRRPRPR